MIKDGFISKHQSIEILEKFFELNCSFDQLSKIFEQRRTQSQLAKFIKEKFKNLVLEIETNLCKASYISTMKLYDHSSEKMFDELIKMNLYCDKEIINDFLEEEKCKLLKFEKIPSYKRFRIYKHFIEYAEKNRLFNYSILSSEVLPSDKRPYQQPSKLFPPNQLELINNLYEIYLGDYERIEQKLKQKGFSEPQYEAPLLLENLANLELIGLYRCYRKSVNKRGGKGMDWGDFVKDQSEFMEQLRNWDKNLLVLLVRIAIEGIHSVSAMQIRLVCVKIGRRYQDKPVIKGRIVDNEIWKKMGLNSGHKNQSEIITKLRLQLIDIITPKIQFHPTCN